MTPYCSPSHNLGSFRACGACVIFPTRPRALKGPPLIGVGSNQVEGPVQSEPQGNEEESSIHPLPARSEVPRAQGLGAGGGSVFTVPWPVSYPSSPRMEWRAPASQALTAAYVEAPAQPLQSASSSRTKGAPWKVGGHREIHGSAQLKQRRGTGHQVTLRRISTP